MERNSFLRNEIPEPPSIAAMSSLGWAAMLPTLVEHGRSGRAEEERDAMFDALPERRPSLRNAILALLGGRRSTAAWIRSAFADERTSAA